MNILLKGIATYSATLDDEDFYKKGFDFQAWAEKELGMQVVDFMPDKIELVGYEIVKKEDWA